MEIIALICGNLLAISLLLNLFLFLRLRKKPQKQETYELREFLQDMLSGPGLVKVTRLDPANVILRSPNQ